MRDYMKLGIILKALFSNETNALKEAFKSKILEKFLSQSDPKHIVKWMPLLTCILLPYN